MPNRTGKTTTALNLRTGPGTGFDVIEILKPFTPLEILDTRGDWFEVSAVGKTGFVHSAFVKLDPPPPPEPVSPPGRTGKTKTRLNMRTGPGTTNSIIRILPANTEFSVLGEQGKWLHIQVDGMEGFVHSDFVVLSDPPPPDPPKPQELGRGVTTSNLNLRVGPGTRFMSIRVLPPNTDLVILAQAGKWLRVRVGDAQGFVHGDFVSWADRPASPPSPPEEERGKTRTNLNLRRGPGTSFEVIRVLPLGTEVVVLEHQGDWLRVRAGLDEGFVHRDFVILDSEGVPDDFIDPGGDPANPELPPLPDVPLEPTLTERIELGPEATNTEKRIARTWNRFGGLLAVLSERLRIDPGVAVAVLMAESAGTGFDRNGRMIIRFENHIFYRLWGQSNRELFERHFRFSPERIWQGHAWRPSVSSPWRTFHGNQDAEWEVFTFARQLDDTAAKKSISMGGPQIMGFNYAALGYESVDQMFAAFSAGEVYQIVGLFNFIQGPGTHSERVLALQRLDFEAFAAQYNGPGQTAVYGSIIRRYYETFKRLRES
ncbi:MAG: DUF3380 domain-containing protein [Chloroflexi bacterium]|nr:MAG: DUF3380 domain-containing protein [Chloroflexota bacterium]